MRRARAEVAGAVSIVNAVGTARGATLGVKLMTSCTIEASPGSGLEVVSGSRSISSRLVARTVEEVVPARERASHRISLRLDSEVPAGYGLKSSSAISLAVAMCCSRLFRPRMSDRALLAASADASLAARVSITGAFDDACACYYGGINVTDNATRRLIARSPAPQDIAVLVMIPRARRRGNPRRLARAAPALRAAWDLAREHGDYWNAMTLNGLAAARALGADPALVLSLIEAGALGASVSGNGPAVAAVARRKDAARVRRALAAVPGARVIDAAPNNARSRCALL